MTGDSPAPPTRVHRHKNTRLKNSSVDIYTHGRSDHPHVRFTGKKRTNGFDELVSDDTYFVLEHDAWFSEAECMSVIFMHY